MSPLVATIAIIAILFMMTPPHDKHTGFSSEVTSDPTPADVISRFTPDLAGIIKELRRKVPLGEQKTIDCIEDKVGELSKHVFHTLGVPGHRHAVYHEKASALIERMIIARSEILNDLQAMYISLATPSSVLALDKALEDMRVRTLTHIKVAAKHAGSRIAKYVDQLHAFPAKWSDDYDMSYDMSLPVM